MFPAIALRKGIRSKIRIYTMRRKYEQDKPVLVLSHWGIDHYHCLVMDEELMSTYS